MARAEPTEAVPAIENVRENRNGARDVIQGTGHETFVPVENSQASDFLGEPKWALPHF